MKYFLVLLLIVFQNIILQAEYSIVDITPSSPGTSTGAILTHISGSAGSFTVTLLDDGGNVIQPYDNDAVTDVVYGMNGLNAGNYKIVITDRFGCEEIIEVTIPLSCSFDIEVEDIRHLTSCNSSSCSNDGSLSIVSIAGVSYSWTGQTQKGSFTATGRSISNLSPGTYHLTVILNGCEEERTFEIMECSPRSYLPTDVELVSLKGILDPSRCVGHIQLELSNPNRQFVYHWEDRFGNRISESLTITELCSGVYTFFLDDGCSTVQEIEYTIPGCTSQNLAVEILPTPIACGEFKGSMAAQITGGAPPYFYNWSNGSDKETATNLGQGGYSLTITDACGVTASAFADLGCACRPIELISSDPCFSNGFLGIDFDLTQAELEIVDEDAIGVGDIFEVKWWDGQISTYTRTEGGNISRDGIDDKSIVEPESGLQIVEKCATVTNLTTGCSYVTCSRFQLRHPECRVLKEPWYGEEIGSVIRETGVNTGFYIARNVCFGSVNNPDKDETFIPFSYYPNDIENPCSGGGFIYSHPCADNGWMGANIIVHPTSEATEISNIEYSFFDDANDFFNDRCLITDVKYCLFNNVQVIGLPMSGPIAVKYCINNYEISDTTITDPYENIFDVDCESVVTTMGNCQMDLFCVTSEIEAGVTPLDSTILIGNYQFCRKRNALDNEINVFCPDNNAIFNLMGFYIDPAIMRELEQQALPDCSCLQHPSDATCVEGSM